MKAIVVKRSWVALHPFQRLDVAYWLEVNKALAEMGVTVVAPSDEQMKLAFARVEDKIASGHEKVRSLRAKAQALFKKAREAEAALPVHARPRYIPRRA